MKISSFGAASIRTFGRPSKNTRNTGKGSPISFLTSSKGKTKKETRYRRGDWSPDGKKRFWSYTHGAEGWIDAARFDEAKERTSYWCQVAASSRNLLEQVRQEHFEKTKPKPRNKPNRRK